MDLTPKEIGALEKIREAMRELSPSEFTFSFTRYTQGVSSAIVFKGELVRIRDDWSTCEEPKVIDAFRLVREETQIAFLDSSKEPVVREVLR